MKSFSKYLTWTKNSILDLLFPIECLDCSKEGEWLCQNCLDSIPSRQDLCPLCDRKSFLNQICYTCQKNSYLKEILVFGNYSHPLLHQAIRIFKYHSVADLAKPLAELLKKLIKNSSFLSLDTKYPLAFRFLGRGPSSASAPQDNLAPLGRFLIIPVPLHPRRQLERGFNQAELLAQEVAPLFKITLQKNLLIRSDWKKPQVELDLKERGQNVKGAFVVRKEAQDIIKGKNILLIDDVITSGATLKECAKALREAGARKIWGLALAKG